MLVSFILTQNTTEIKVEYNKVQQSLVVASPDGKFELASISNDALLEVIDRTKDELGEVKLLNLVGLKLEREFSCSELTNVENLICVGCDFPSFDYSYVKFDLVQLDECKFGYFISKSIRSNGHLIITNCVVTGATVGLRNEALSGLIDIRNAHVSGHISISNLDFSTANKSSASYTGISIDASTVDGRMTLDQIGDARSINLKDLNIEHGFWLGDSKLLYGATFKNITSGSGFEVKGSQFGWQVFLRNVTAKGDIKISNCEISKEKGKALSLAGIHVTGTLFIQECQIIGQCFLHTVVTEMNVDISSNKLLGNDSDDIELMRLVSSKIGGFIIVKENCIQGMVHFWRLDINAKLSFKDNFCKSVAKLSKSTNSRNAFTAKNCIVGDDIEIVNSRFDGGVCAFGSIVKGRFDFLNNHFTLSGMKIAAPSKKISSIIRAVQFFWGSEVTASINHTLGGCTQNLDLSDMKIQGDLKISKFTQAEGVRVYVRLDNTSCRTLSDGNFSEVTGLPPFVSYESLFIKTVDEEEPVREIRKRIDRMFKFGRRGNYLPTGPQPFAHLARLLNARGDQELADYATLNMKRALTRQSSSISRRLFGRVFDLTFGYGLSKIKALTSISVWVLLGTVGVQLAQDKEIMVVDALKVVELGSSTRLSYPSDIAAHKPTPIVAICDRDIVPALYAFELMVPIVDLGQERQCSLLTSPQENSVTAIELNYWWVAKYLYTLIGWLIISISIVTFSGAIRIKDS